MFALDHRVYWGFIFWSFCSFKLCFKKKRGGGECSSHRNTLWCQCPTSKPQGDVVSDPSSKKGSHHFYNLNQSTGPTTWIALADCLHVGFHILIFLPGSLFVFLWWQSAWPSVSFTWVICLVNPCTEYMQYYTKIHVGHEIRVWVHVIFLGNETHKLKISSQLLEWYHVCIYVVWEKSLRNWALKNCFVLKKKKNVVLIIKLAYAFFFIGSLSSASGHI